MLVDFLKTKRTKEELTLTFDILNEFKKCESSTEWGFHPFESWKRLEQFQDYLALLIEEKEYECDDEIAKSFLAEVKNGNDIDGEDFVSNLMETKERRMERFREEKDGKI